MEMKKDLEVRSCHVIDVTIEGLTNLINALQLAKQRTLPGMEMLVDITPTHTLRYAPEQTKKAVNGLGPPIEVVTKAFIDRVPSI